MPMNGDDSPSQQEFSYRTNDDGSIDSICMACYRTIASAISKVGLADEERKHTCNPEDVFRLNSARGIGPTTTPVPGDLVWLSPTADRTD